MSDSNRLLIAALGLVALIAFGIAWSTWPSVPRLSDYGEASPRNSQYAPGGSKCEPATLAAITSARERLREADACAKEAEEYRQNTADLIQQTRAADAAQAQADIASQVLWTGWFQTIGGFLTLCAAVAAAIYARDAAREGKRSADLAVESLTETKKVTAAQLRPYVAITDDNDLLALPAPFNRQSVVPFKIKNFGQVPAQSVRLSTGDQIINEPMGNAWIDMSERFGDYGLLAPGDDRTDSINAREFNLNELADIAIGKIKLVLRLRVDYTWDGGSDSDEITMILDDPATSRWQLMDERRRLHGPLR